MTVRVRAPATTANLGPGFDCAAVALDLWNEVEVTEGPGTVDLSHLGVQAFARLAPVAGKQFRWIDSIPRGRGLGSSAAVIALGLVAALRWLGRTPSAEDILGVGAELEGHADNLAAALVGGVCLTWGGRIARIADTVPAVPIVLVPEGTVSTEGSRARLPTSVPHEDAAITVAHAALLGASLASGSAHLFAQALEDRLHEPYRANDAPLLGAVRDELPSGALGATLSGSGPAVVVWARTDAAAACAEELASRFGFERVMRLAVASSGALTAASD